MPLGIVIGFIDERVNKMKQKSKLMIGGIVIVLIIFFFLYQKSHVLVLKNDSITYEYGQSVSLDAKDYLETSHLTQEQLSSITIETNLKNENDQHYPAVGNYQLTFFYQQSSVTLEVIIKDTTSPVFKNFESSLTISLDQKPDYSKLYQPVDLSPVTFSYDDSLVHYDQAGQYHVTIKAIDSYQNQTSQTITLIVENKDTDYVKVKDLIPSIVVDLKYATKDNFTHQVIYHFRDAYLRYGTVKKLKRVQDDLLSKGYSLKIWDAYRPFSAQKKLWEVVPNPRYVADPAKGKKSHNLGGTVDITMVKADGSEIDMPTEFDNFTLQADRNYQDIENQQAIQNAKLLESVMEKYGFQGYQNEWWHYNDTHTYTYVEFEPEENKSF